MPSAASGALYPTKNPAAGAAGSGWDFEAGRAGTLHHGQVDSLRTLAALVRLGVEAHLLALLEAWVGIFIAFHTDWPTSFCITALSAVLYLLALAVRRG